MIFLLLVIVPLELVALGLGIAGAFQRRRRRSFAVLGIASSLLEFAVVYIRWFITR